MVYYAIVVLLLFNAYACTAFTTSRLWKSDIKTSPLFATWSNGQAVQDYQNFLASGEQEIVPSADTASVFFGPSFRSPMIDLLVELGVGGDVVLTPGQELPDEVGGRSSYPIYVVLPPTLLEAILANLPESYKERAEDFVFFSGGLDFGNIEDVLKERGFCRDNMTQVLVSGMRILKNNRVIDLKAFLGVDANGEDKLAGECTACGKWAGSIAARLDRGNVFCRTEFYREWRRKMWERSVFDAVYHLIGAVRDEPTTVADVANYYGDEASEILWEMSQLLRGWRAITLMYGFEERLMGVGESSGVDQPCTVDAEMFPYVWGSSVFLESKTFVTYLHYAQQAKGLLPEIALPQRADEDFTSHMLQGNLRADGVV